MDEGFITLFLWADLVTHCDLSRQRMCELVAAGGVTDASALLAIANDESRSMGVRCIASAVHMVLHRPDFTVDQLRELGRQVNQLPGVSELPEFIEAQRRSVEFRDEVTP
jgi:hypothetical protein